MGDETVKPLVVEPAPVKQEEKGYLGKITKMFQATAQAPEPDVLGVAEKLRGLNREHIDRIEACREKITRLKEGQEKLRGAMETLRGMGIAIPEECALRHRRMMNEENQLKDEVEKEKVFLNYLETRILTMLE